MDTLKLPSDSKLAGKLVEGHLKNEQARIERGKIGDLLGGKSSVPANIAAILVIVCIGALIAAMFCAPTDNSFSTKDKVATLSSLITLVVGYLFGRTFDQ